MPAVASRLEELLYLPAANVWRGVRDRRVGSDDRGCGELMGQELAGLYDVFDFHIFRGEIVAEEPAVTFPIELFGAHNSRARYSGG